MQYAIKDLKGAQDSLIGLGDGALVFGNNVCIQLQWIRSGLFQLTTTSYRKSLHKLHNSTKTLSLTFSYCEQTCN